MLEQLKYVITRPTTDKTPSEQYLNGMSPQSQVKKTDVSTAFERSGWVYI